MQIQDGKVKLTSQQKIQQALKFLLMKSDVNDFKHLERLDRTKEVRLDYSPSKALAYKKDRKAKMDQRKKAE